MTLPVSTYLCVTFRYVLQTAECASWRKTPAHAPTITPCGTSNRSGASVDASSTAVVMATAIASRPRTSVERCVCSSNHVTMTSQLPLGPPRGLTSRGRRAIMTEVRQTTLWTSTVSVTVTQFVFHSYLCKYRCFAIHTAYMLPISALL